MFEYNNIFKPLKKKTTLMERVSYRDGIDWNSSQGKLHEKAVIDAFFDYRRQILDQHRTTGSESEDNLILGYTRILKELREKAGQLFLTVTRYESGDLTFFSSRLGIITGSNWIHYDPPRMDLHTTGLHVTRVINAKEGPIPNWRYATEEAIPIPFDHLSSIYREMGSPLTDIVKPTLRLVPGNKRVEMFFKDIRNNTMPHRYFPVGSLREFDLSFIEALKMLNFPTPNISLEDLMNVIEDVVSAEEIILRSKDTRETGALSSARFIIKGNLEIARGYKDHETYGERIKELCQRYEIPL